MTHQLTIGVLLTATFGASASRDRAESGSIHLFPLKLTS